MINIILTSFYHNFFHDRFKYFHLLEDLMIALISKFKGTILEENSYSKNSGSILCQLKLLKFLKGISILSPNEPHLKNLGQFAYLWSICP